MHIIQGKNYISYFNEVTGEYLRTGIIENGVDTGKDPFMAEFPELLSLEHMDFTCLDTCEGGRWSAYISADMKMMPCSFAHEMSQYSVSLKENSVMSVWHSKEFDAFRNIPCEGFGKALYDSTI